jgi:hypothetical protein
MSLYDYSAETLLRKVAFFVLLASVVFLASCTSIPLSTMWKLKDYSSENIKDIDPLEFRARVTHQSSFYIKSEGSVFSLELSNDDEKVKFEIPLEVIGTEDVMQGVFRSREFTKTMLKMSEAGVKDFMKLQKDAGKLEDKYNKTWFKVKCSGDLKDRSNPPKHLELTIEIKLNGNEDFFTLIDSAKMKLEPTEETKE